jgi:hypothetical protein
MAGTVLRLAQRKFELVLFVTMTSVPRAGPFETLVYYPRVLGQPLDRSMDLVSLRFSLLHIHTPLLDFAPLYQRAIQGWVFSTLPRKGYHGGMDGLVVITTQTSTFCLLGWYNLFNGLFGREEDYHLVCVGS